MPPGPQHDADPPRADAGSTPPPARKRRRRAVGGDAAALIAHGEPMIWLSGGALWICLAMILGILGLIVAKGMGTFWPKPVVALTTVDGQSIVGEPTRGETFMFTKGMYLALDDADRAAIRPRFTQWDTPQPPALGMTVADAASLTPEARDAIAPLRSEDDRLPGVVLLDEQKFQQLPDQMREDLAPTLKRGYELVDHGVYSGRRIEVHRQLIRTGNYELTHEHFEWVSDFQIAQTEQPQWQVVVERLSHGRFYGRPIAALEVQPWHGGFDERRKLVESAPETLVLVARRDGQAHERLKLAEARPGDRITHVITGQYEDPDEAWRQFELHHAPTRQRYAEAQAIRKHELGALSREERHSKLNVTQARIDYGAGSPEHLQAQKEHEATVEQLRSQRQKLNEEIRAIEEQNDTRGLLFQTSGGDQKYIEYSHIVRAYPANQLTFSDKLATYGSRWWEFLSSDPREANSEGGVWPAIFGTVVMTLLMCIAVVPFGVLAALYLREYAKAGFIISTVRIAINNLAGVPSIVFGVFGLGFFCYLLGRYIDGGPRRAFGVAPWPEWIWAAVLAQLAALAVGAIVLSAISGASRGGGRGWPTRLSLVIPLVAALLVSGGVLLFNLASAGAWMAAGLTSDQLAWPIGAGLALTLILLTLFAGRDGRPIGSVMPGRFAMLMWVASAALLVRLLVYTPYFTGFFEARLEDNQPVFGSDGLLWASLTLALLTLPVVIVATEEALAAVPASMREGSYACGASKWQTIRRIVLPRALPGIMTGTILAMARGAGEVAPLMLVGVVKVAPELPLSWRPDEQFGVNRSFMHLGFHIYDVGFQSQNSEAAKPMVFTTTLLLILIVAALNLAAIWLRARLRKRFVTGQF